MWEIMSRIRNLSSGSPLQAPEMTTAEIHALTNVEDGMIVYNTDTRQLLTHVAGSWLAISNSGSAGTVTNVDTGVGLTGGPITGAGTIELTETGVEAGEYTAANITVDAQGRIVSASSGDIGTVDSIVGTAGQIDVDSTDIANPIVSLANTTVEAGEYTAANITVDAQGRIVSASSGDIGTVDSIVGTAGQIDVDSTDIANPIVSLANTTVEAGEYTAANITVDAQGRIVSASSGDIGTVDSIVGTAGQIDVDSTDVANPIVSLANTTVEAGEYTAANITVDAQGRIVSASSTLLPETTTPNSIVTWGADGSLLNNSTTQIDSAGNMTLNGTVTASSFASVGNLDIAESGKLRITSTNQGVVQINASPDLTELVNINFNQDLYFPSDAGTPGASLMTDGRGNLSWLPNLSSIISRNNTIYVDNIDPIDVNIELPDTGVEAGEYTAANITVDAQGRIVSASSGDIGTVDSIVGTEGQIDVDSTDVANPIVSLANTTVEAGEYTAGNITVDAQGRITAASNGSSASGVDSVVGTEGQIDVDSTDVANPIVSLANTTVEAGTYTNPSSITFDGYGRATSVISGNPILHGMIVLESGTGSLDGILPAGVTKGKVTVIGGGGNGGNTSITTAVGTGGGAGGTVIKYITDLSASSSYSVGSAGEASTFTSSTVSLTANAGSNGVVANSTAIQLGGAGGEASGGDINIPGQRGDNCSTSSTVGSGKGGNSSLASGGSSVVVSGNGDAGLYGSGGSGAFKNTAGIGGIGGSGVIIIEY